MDPPYHPVILPEAAAAAAHNKPPLLRLIERIKSPPLSFKAHQSLVLTLTFFAYLTYHAARKTSSIVKSALDPQTPAIPSLTSDPKSGWEPFNGPNGTALLGQLDVAFLFVYAVGTFLSGHFGDRMDLREFLTVGMLGTALFTSLFGVGYWADIHSFHYYLVVQMSAGLFQSTGWPSVVAVVGNWFGKKKRGLIMGVWNAHVSLGNIAGSVLASVFLKYGWGWSMVVPSLGISSVGIVVFLLLPVAPADVGVEEEDDDDEAAEPLVRTPSNLRDPVGFLEALKIPGVVTFALSLFFAKMVAYTFLYWLPYYISHTAIDGRYLSSAEAGTLSTLFDVGGLIGGILAGHISDHSDAKAMTAASFMYCAIPALYLFRTLGHSSIFSHVLLMFIAGIFVNAPYALITTAVSADLGTHGSLKDNSRALATVTAIIDGTGSVGAALGPLLTGYLSAKSWDAVFGMLIGAALVAGLLLTRLVVAEVAAKVAGGGGEPPSGGRERLPTSKGSDVVEV